MWKKLNNIISIIVITGIMICMVPFHISAISGYSYDLEADECIWPIVNSNTGTGNKNNYVWQFNDDVNVVIMEYYNTSSDVNPNFWGIFAFSNSTFKGRYSTYTGTDVSCPVNPSYSNNAIHYNSNGYDFYYYYSYVSVQVGLEGLYTNVNSLYHSNISELYGQSSSGNTQMTLEAYQYYGASPGPVVTYGDLITGYSTKFVTSNFEGLNDRNIDTITWSDNDTNGNFIGGLDYQVEIRALPAYYTANSAAELVQQTVVNLVKGLATWYSNGVIQSEPEQYYTLVKTSASRKEFSIMWSDVINHFPQNWARLFNEGSLVRNVSNQEVWYKTGWLYEIRYLYNEGEEDEYISDWQTIYQVTAVDPGTSTQIIQTAPQGLSPELYNLLQTVNTLNNTVQNWNINGVPVNMEPQTTPTQDGSWLEYIVDAISKIVGQIVETLGNIVSAILGFGADLIEGLFNLVTDLGVNIIDFFSDLIDSITTNNESIDLTLPEWDIDVNNDALDEFKRLGNGYVNIFLDSGLGYMLLIPLIIILLRLVF